MSTIVSVYRQDCCGRIHYRVMRDDGQRIFERHMTDFESKDEAVSAIEGEFRRKKLGHPQIRILDRELIEVQYRGVTIRRKWGTGVASRERPQPDEFEFVHRDYDGPEDRRFGWERTLEACLARIDEIMPKD